MHTDKIQNNKTLMEKPAYISDEPLRMYLIEIGQYRVLSQEEMTDCFRRMEEGDTGCRELIINSNLKLVIKAVRSFNIPNVDFMNLIQEGNIGLIKAVDNFRLSFGVAFSTYAYYWIRQKIMRYIDNNARLIRLPVHMSKYMQQYRKFYNDYMASYGKEPDDETVSAGTGISIQNIQILKLNISFPISLDDTLKEDSDTTIGEMIEDSMSLSPQEYAEINEMNKIIHDNMASFSDREKYIIFSRFELNGAEKKSYNALGDDIGLSRERIRQHEHNVLETLNNPDFARLCIDYYNGV